MTFDVKDHCVCVGEFFLRKPVNHDGYSGPRSARRETFVSLDVYSAQGTKLPFKGGTRPCAALLGSCRPTLQLG